MNRWGPRIGAAMLSFILLVNLTAPSTLDAQPRSGKVVLKEGVLVPLKLRENVSSDSAVEGTIVDFEVTSDVKVGDVVVIKAGALGKGTISKAERAKFAGQEGKVQFSIELVRAVDGTFVPLRGTLTRAGEDQQTLAIGGAILCLPLILIKGKEGVVPAGTEFKAYVSGDREIIIGHERSENLFTRFLAWLIY